MILTLALLLIVVVCLGLLRLYHHLLDTFLLLSIQLRGLKTMIAGLRHDVSLDQANVDSHLDEIDIRIYDTTKSLHDHLQRNLIVTQAEIRGEHVKTRKDVQEVKTALRDDEKDDQRQKAQARRKKKP